jgi:hypothetical protein
VALRNRLIAMGYLERSITAEYDARLQAAVVEFQLDNGINADGIAGAETIQRRQPLGRGSLERRRPAHGAAALAERRHRFPTA